MLILNRAAFRTIVVLLAEREVAPELVTFDN